MASSKYIQKLQEKMALQNISLLRTCPPDNVLFKKGPQVRRHLEICPMCQERIMEEPAYAKFSPTGMAVQEPEPAAPGQVRRISSELAGWGPGPSYYNPPQVLLLEPAGQEAFSLAQLSLDESFCVQEEDVFIPELQVFAQPWNVYSLAQEHLGSCTRQLSQDIVRKVLQRMPGPFQESDQSSHLFWFRQSELELGSFFAQQSLALLLQRLEDPLKVTDPYRLRQMFLSSHPDGRCPEHVPQDPYLFLAECSLPEEEQALAAAEAKHIPCNLLLMKGDDFRLRSALARISQEERSADRLEILGSLAQGQGQELRAWLKTPSGFLEPQELELDPEHGYFRIVFQEKELASGQTGRLILLLIEHEQL